MLEAGASARMRKTHTSLEQAASEHNELLRDIHSHQHLLMHRYQEQFKRKPKLMNFPQLAPITTVKEPPRPQQSTQCLRQSNLAESHSQERFRSI